MVGYAQRRCCLILEELYLIEYDGEVRVVTFDAEKKIIESRKLFFFQQKLLVFAL